jgi:hypothetical protein
MSHEQKIDPGNNLKPARNIDFATGGNKQTISGAPVPDGDIKSRGLIMVIRREFEKLARLFDSTTKKQQQERTMHLEIIGKLEFRKSRLQQKIAAERERDENSARYRNLNMKSKVVSKLISRAHENVEAIPN